MSTPEQRKRLKSIIKNQPLFFSEWCERGYQYPHPKIELYPDDLRGLQCGAKPERVNLTHRRHGDVFTSGQHKANRLWS